MEFWRKVLEVLDTTMETPAMYGWFHILCWAIALGSAVFLCFLYKKGVIKNVNRVVFVTAILVVVLEIYKLVILGISYEAEIEYEFRWGSFPWQFCSMPMYIGLLVGITRGKVRNALCCFLATYAVFAGTMVMIYPGDVFVETVGVNIQTMICHGSMITIGIFLYYTNYVKAELKTLLRAIPVFVACLASAVLVNEIGNRAGLTEETFFNMFYISPYEDGYLPVYRVVQGAVPYPWCLVIYALGFTLAALIVLMVAMVAKGVSRLINEGRETTSDQIG